MPELINSEGVAMCVGRVRENTESVECVCGDEDVKEVFIKEEEKETEGAENERR